MKKHRNKTLKFLAMTLIMTSLLSLWSGSISFADSSDNIDTISNLPTVYITTKTGRNPGRDDNSRYFEGSMRVQLNEYFADCENAYTGKDSLPMGIRTRGNSTRTFLGVTQTGKYSYRLKLSEKADMFGFGASKDWILLANVYDVTSMRNMTAYNLAKALGIAYFDSTWVTLYLNGEYRGIYQFCEAIQVSSDRVDITDWDEIAEDIATAIAIRENLTLDELETLEKKMKDNLTWVTSGKIENYKISDYYGKKLDITSGYLIEYDSFDNSHDARPPLFSGKYTPAGVELKIDTPAATHTNPEMLAYVRNLILDFEEAVMSDDFCTSDGRHYSELCDMDALVDFWILQTVVKNGEFGIRSMFFYIEDGKIHWGPVWDFDCGAGNRLTVSTSAGEWNGVDNNRNHWYRALYNDPEFTALLQERYAELRPLFYDMVDGISIYREYIGAEARRDFEKYGKRPFNNPQILSSDFDREFDFYLKWQKDRLTWLDQNLLKDTLKIGDAKLSNKSTLKITYYNKATLPENLFTQYGRKSSYIYKISDESENKDLRFNLSWTHSTLDKIKMYINGKLVNEYSVSDKKTLSRVIDISSLDLTNGAENIICFRYYNQNGDFYSFYYATVLVSDVGNPSAEQAVLQLGTNAKIYSIGDSVVLPTASAETSKGMKFLGWTDGNEIYEAGSELKLEKSISLYEKWERSDMRDLLYASSIKNTYEAPLVGSEGTGGENIGENTQNGSENTENPNISNTENKNSISTVVIVCIAVLTSAVLGGCGFALTFALTKKKISKK